MSVCPSKWRYRYIVFSEDMSCCIKVCCVLHTVHVGLLLIFVFLILAASISQQDLSLFGHGLWGRLTHCTLSTHFPVVIAVIYTRTHTDSYTTTQRMMGKTNKTNGNSALMLLCIVLLFDLRYHATLFLFRRRSFHQFHNKPSTSTGRKKQKKRTVLLSHHSSARSAKTKTAAAMPVQAGG